MHFPEDAGLSNEDQLLLGRLIEAEFDIEAIEVSGPAERRRLQALMSLFGLLEDYPVDDADDALLELTTDAIRNSRGLVGTTFKMEPEQLEHTRPKRFARFRMPDLITVAAVVLIAASIAWPTMSSIRQRSIDAMCVSNMQSLGSAFSLYAADHQGRVPMASAGFGHSLAELIDIFPLVQGDYCSQGHVNCPGHHSHQQPSYSYQVQLPGRPVIWSTMPHRVVLGDRNPLIDARRSGVAMPPQTNSANHRERGQNLLMSDGSTLWLDRPVRGSDDNVWLISGQQAIQPGELPSSADDIFLIH